MSSRPLTAQEMHNLAMNHVGKDLESRGFEFIAINSQLKKHPQFVCIDRHKQYYFVLVRAVILPQDPDTYDLAWMATFQQHAAVQKAKVLYAGVGLRNKETPASPHLNKPYLLQYSGIQLIGEPKTKP